MNDYLTYAQAIKVTDQYFDKYINKLGITLNNSLASKTVRNYFMRLKRLVIKDIDVRMRRGAMFTKEIIFELCEKINDEHKSEFFEIYKNLRRV